MSTSNIQALLDDLCSSDSDKQRQALVDLEDIGDPAAIPYILPLLTSDSAMLRWCSVETIAAMPEAELEELAPALLPFLEDTDEALRNAAAEALCTLAYPAALEPFKQMLHHDPYCVARASAAEALGYFEDDPPIADLLQALDDEEPTVQMYAASSLGLIAPPSLLSQLELALVNSSELRVKGELIIATYRLGAPEGLRRLIKLINVVDEALINRTGEMIVFCILNQLQYLTEQNPPTSLREDAPLLREALLDLARHIPTQHHAVQHILDNLAQLE